MSERRREIVAWGFYDFANSAFTTLVVTFIFSSYFTSVVASDPTRGAVLWSRAVNISAIVVALMMPLLGAVADFSGRKKLFLACCTVLSASFTTLLFFVEPGMEIRALIFFIIANIGYEASYVFYNAFLPEVSTPDTIGRVSGFGQGLGYVGGLLCLLVAFGMIRGWLPSDAHLAVRATNLLVAVWFVVFAIPIFLFVDERRPEGRHSILEATRGALGRLAGTAREFRRYREAAKFLVARMIYNDGLVTVFSFAAIYAGAVFGMKTDGLIVMGLVLNIVSGVGSWVFGPVNDRIGGKKTITITLVMLIVATIIGASAKTVSVFWVAAIILGLMIGPNQAASRSLLGVFVPPAKHAEFFGFFAFSGRLASVLGPLAYGTVLQATGSQRWAMASIGAFFILGLLLLMFVDEKKGIDLAAVGELKIENLRPGDVR